MPKFALDPETLVKERDRAAALATSATISDVLTGFRVGERLDDVALAALFLSKEVATDDLLNIARQAPRDLPK